MSPKDFDTATFEWPFFWCVRLPYRLRVITIVFDRFMHNMLKIGQPR
jgi:hypothetical protein